MPKEPVQLALAVAELMILAAGFGLLLTILFSSRRRQRWLGTNALPYWDVTGTEFLLSVVIILLASFVVQTGIHLGFSDVIAKARDRSGLEVFIYGAGMHGGFLLGCALFPVLRRKLYSNYGTEPPPLRRGPSLPWGTALRYAAGTVLVALPLLSALSFGWTALLRTLSLPDEPQDLIGIFNQTKSPFVIVGMLFVACVLAPIAEELLFRAGLYRFVRQKLGRKPALLISGLCFGALHGNLAGFLPLGVLGMLLAIVYESTGSLRVNVIAHAFFNLNTILIVLSGLPEAATS